MTTEQLQEYYAKPENRLRVYEGVLGMIESGGNTFICNVIKHFHFVRSKSNFKIEYFPELLKHKPARNKSTGGWFEEDDRQSRIDLLNEAINEVKQIINHEREN